MLNQERGCLQVKQEKGHFTVTLKQSVTGDLSAGYTASLFEDLEAAAEIK